MILWKWILYALDIYICVVVNVSAKLVQVDKTGVTSSQGQEKRSCL